MKKIILTFVLSIFVLIIFGQSIKIDADTAVFSDNSKVIFETYMKEPLYEDNLIIFSFYEQIIRDGTAFITRQWSKTFYAYQQTKISGTTKTWLQFYLLAKQINVANLKAYGLHAIDQ